LTHSKIIKYDILLNQIAKFILLREFNISM